MSDERINIIELPDGKFSVYDKWCGIYFITDNTDNITEQIHKEALKKYRGAWLLTEGEEDVVQTENDAVGLAGLIQNAEFKREIDINEDYFLERCEEFKLCPKDIISMTEYNWNNKFYYVVFRH